MPPNRKSNIASIAEISKVFTERVKRVITPIEISKPGSKERIRVNALWDTGSTGCCIIMEAAGLLGILSTGQGLLVHTGSNDGDVRDTYLIDMVLPGNIVYKNIEVIESSNQSGTLGEYSIVIGMNIIRTGDFTLENIDGKTKMTFKTLKSENKNGI